MSKYDRLWKHVKKEDKDILLLFFEEIEKIAGVPIDHSFLNYKKELPDHGYKADKISLKNQTVIFIKIKSPTSCQPFRTTRNLCKSKILFYFRIDFVCQSHFALGNADPAIAPLPVS